MRCVRSIGRWAAYGFDHEDGSHFAAGLELQPELFLQCLAEGGQLAGRCCQHGGGSELKAGIVGARQSGSIEQFPVESRRSSVAPVFVLDQARRPPPLPIPPRPASFRINSVR